MISTYYKLRKIRLLRDLIRHNDRWSHQIGLAKPIQKLIKDCDPKNSNLSQKIKEKIDKLLPVVGQYAKDANIPHNLIFKDKDREDKINMFVNYHDLKEFSKKYKNDNSNAKTFDKMISLLNTLDGYYEELLKQKIINTFNPLVWAATILRIPIYIFEKAGLKTGSKIFENIYAAIAQVIVLILLSLLATKLGVSIPWDKISIFT